MGNTHGSTVSLPPQHPRGPREHGEPVLVLVLDCARPHAGSVRYRLGAVSSVVLGRGAERRAVYQGTELTIDVADKWMSSQHARIEREPGRWILTDDSKNGTVVDGHTTKRVTLQDRSLIEVGHTAFVFFEHLPIEQDAPAVAERLPTGEPTVDTVLPAWHAELTRLYQVAPSPIPVMLEGEAGVGKEALARMIHERSGRSGQLIHFECDELPAELVDGELFGDEHFDGLIRAANGGTLVLDNLGDLPTTSQAALLRVLQSQTLAPVVAGGSPVALDLRVVSSTDRDLEAMVAKGTFRRELFAWLSAVRIAVPALRERRADLGLLIGALHQRLFGVDHPGFAVDAARALLEYAWPLNQWELEQALAAAHVEAGSDEVRLEHLPATVRARHPIAAPAAPILDDAEQELHDTVLAALREHRGNVSATARSLGKDRKQIQRWMKRFGFDPESFDR